MKLEVGSSPCCESCAQVGTPNYQEQAKIELRAYKNQLLRILGDRQVSLQIKSFPHDFGSYYELVATGSEEDVFWLEDNLPENWDNEAKIELGENHPDVVKLKEQAEELGYKVVPV